MGLLLLTALVGCGTRLPDPDPREVSPSFGYYLQDTAVRITGTAFYPQIGVDASGRRDADVDATFDGILVGPDGGKGRYALRGLTLNSTESISAIVPAGLPAGAYDLEIDGPTGASGSLAHAYVVTDTLAERIVVDSDAIVYTVNEQAMLHVALADRRGERVLADAEVEIRVEAEDGSVEAAMSETSLVDGQVVDGVLIGKLGADGEADIPLVVTTPDLVTVTVSPTAPGSALAEGVLKLQFYAGGERFTRIGLPHDDGSFGATAGVPFPVTLELVDEFGNRIVDPDDLETLFLGDACDDYRSDPIRFTGLVAVNITMKRASSVACRETRIETLLGPEGESVPFSVRAGATAALTVEILSGDRVSAGDLVYAYVAPTDAYGNRTDWDGSTFTVTDSVGGVAPDAFACTPAVPSLCTATPVRAADDVALTVTGRDGITGTSGLFDVVAGTPTQIDVDVPKGTASAGSPLTTTVGVYDTWDNLVDPDVYVDDVLFADNSGRITCDQAGTAASGEAVFDCFPTVARADDRLSVAYPEHALTAQSSAFNLVNGPISTVAITSPASTTAGQAMSLAFSATDAYGNPYLVGPSMTLDVADTTGTLSFTTVGLISGSAAKNGSVTRAGTTRVTASASGSVLGTSAPIAVAAGAATTLSVHPLEPWGFVGEALPIEVTALDPWGNRSDLDALASVAGGAAVGTITLGDGFGTAEIKPRTSDPATVFLVSTGTLSGSSPAIMVSERCAAGPTAAMAFGGLDEAVACWDSATGEADIVASFAGSSAGSASIVTWLAAVGDDAATDAGTPSVGLTVRSPGVYNVRGLVVDAEGCGADTSSLAWVGADDGEAVGPMTVSIASSVAAGSGTTDVTISDAVTCTGDPAKGATVTVRTDRGEITDATPTGAGLEATLDATGSVTVTLDASGADTDGTATDVALGSTRVARGEDSAAITGDNAHPRVREQSPSGDTAGLVDSVTIRFTEPLLESSVTSSAFAFTGPETVAIDEVTLDATGTEVTVWLAIPVDASAGAFGVTVGSSIRDDAGNRLDGAETGLASAWTSGFGALGTLGPVSACNPDNTSFRPDGDDGVGIEADAVRFSLATSTTPARWAITVSNADGEGVRYQHPEAAAASGDWLWDGRDDSGAIVANGTYTVEVYAEDSTGAHGASCFATVDVVNREVDDG
jgi:hypothetical protein